jgi:NADH:ubiquinone oxidoreductase subunit 5 (subunit L)/multisubunit Na+/H+ antiporter MnhA subunit
VQSIQLIVFLPLLAAIIAGLGNKALGNVPAKIVTTGALFVSCALSWPIFLSYVAAPNRAWRRCCTGCPPAASTPHGSCASMRSPP